MQKEIWVCITHTFEKPSVVSSDGYSSLSKAQEALCRRIRGDFYWEDDFNYVQGDKLRRHELKRITIEE